MSPVEAEAEARLYRRLLAFVGAVYLLWWLAVHALLPSAFNPLPGRLLVVAFIWGTALSSLTVASIEDHLRSLWMGSLWLLTAHYFYLFFENAGDINWVVGAFITVSAVSLGFLSRASLISYSLFTSALSIGLVVLVPTLRQSVFLPGLLTVLLQANIGLQSRLNVIRNLALSNERFQLLFNATFEGVLIHEQGRVVQVNEALLGMLGLSEPEVIGRKVLELLPTEEREAVGEKIQSGVFSPYATQTVRKDGSVVDVEIRGKPFAHGERPALLMTFQDVSERKRRATELRKTNEALERSNVDLQRFASVASHDLQTPLRAIASFVELLQTTYGPSLDEQGRNWLRRTSQSAAHLRLLIQDLLEYSRVDAATRPFEKVSLREVFDRALSLVEAPVSESHAEITVDVLPELMGDASLLARLFVNLIENAIKYRGSDPPRIHVSAEDKGDAWLIGVRDNGIGIAKRHQERVFEIFKRLHDTTQYPGTGIGLAVCRRVVHRHDGKIWVDSEPGVGSVFYFTLAKGASNEP